MSSPIQSVLAGFSALYREKSKMVAALVASYLADGCPAAEAVNKAMQVAGVAVFLRDAVHRAIMDSVAIGQGVPAIPLLPELTDAWDPSGMILSEKLHGVEREMRRNIIATIQGQQRLSRHAMQAARALYDGYNSGQRIIRRQELPQYMQSIVDFARRSNLTAADRELLLRQIRQARRQVARLGQDDAPNQALKTAYRKLLDGVMELDDEALHMAIRTAVEERSRYVAERIARTEAARAWADGFHAQYDDDDDVVAYRWRLSSRHPRFDICDMYAQSNLWGLGRGLYPKDKTPMLPVHPHCLCHLVPVYASELNRRPQDHIKTGGDAWLHTLNKGQRRDVLGVEGAKAWAQGDDWRAHMRNWSAETATSRLKT